jgi:hypothetical protein
MLKALRTSAMLLALVGAARAGEVLTPPAAPPPSQNIVQQSATDGCTADDAPETLTQIALDLLAVLPSLL